MSDRGLTNLRWAYALVDGLAAAGVRRVILSPGSRSTPLVLACRRHPLVHTRVHLDERGAAFFALGQALADGLPSAVIATSGSGPAHWYPAVLEASLSRVPLLLLSADRPPELQDWGANQTLDQQRLFGVHVREFHAAGLPEDRPKGLRQIRALGIKAVEQSLWPQPGPVHLNLPFREPLVPRAPASRWPAGVGAPFRLWPPVAEPCQAQLEALARSLRGRPGLLVCGPTTWRPELGVAVTALARRLDAPILADPLSGLRFGPWDRSRVLTRYDAFLRISRLRRAPRPPAPAWILRLGRPPVSKTLRAYLSRQRVPQVLLAPDGGWPDPEQCATDLVRADPVRLCQRLTEQVAPADHSDWIAPWLAAEAELTPDLAEEVRRGMAFEGLVVQELVRTLPPGSLLFSGNSLPIRQLDTWSGSGERGPRLICNRGASGIDGNLATLLGLASVASGPVVGLVGDLALAHDLNALLAARGLDALAIVLSNGGGGIFGQLPQAGLADFEHCWLTPQGLELSKVAALFRASHRRVERQGELAPALQAALGEPGLRLIEVVIDRHYSLARHLAYWEGAGAAD
jgi:2-succinyl-5-enolpyruvyl-6-hydroxy-3-cyclohexene-1-carboxylate synthase